MFDIVLYQPEIPPNTGNIIRVCANTGARLHLVQPLGFKLENKQLRRAGLDYHEYAAIAVHAGWQALCDQLQGRRMFAVTTRANRRYDKPRYCEGDVFVFGPETSGLPPAVLDEFGEEYRVRLPMLPLSRSINLSNAVAITVYEAWRQLGFDTGI
ncbi:MAG: tRNA (cytidine(34)-2'-O)-methyltransferase [Burkholderiales bacterium]|nr:tRNA (cytidine(34)-2'-O)-methyltransferase [Burkholderiales bacterium]